ncbi:glycosyltransferase [Sinorhizobium fredii]|uniref:glycosyltransferase n=1 Tax=Rhizobium fredii TaxID=380 RepID=UPI001294C848|nr:glycosyltransferase [Sinorhizobium fredii]MQW94013.1 hypothetical protein [Sinorhizobium fredii]
MSLKVLLDPVYSGLLTGCSSAYKCKALVETVLLKQKRTDWLFYWLVPPALSEAESAWLPQHPNVRYVEYPYLPDRMREYSLFRKELDEILAFNGSFWDFDVLFTSRTSMVPVARSVMSSPRQKTIGHKLKKVMVFEELILLDHRSTVAKSDVLAQELLTLSGYLNADVVYLVTEKEQRGIVETARQYFAPSRVIDMVGKFQRVSQLDTGPARLKEEKFRFRRGERPLCLTFSGRMEKSAANLHEVFDIMDKQWIMKGDLELKTLICTVSQATPLAPPEHTEVRVASREQFWKAAREEMDLMLVLHRDAEFSLSMVEPMVFGVPLVVIDQDWSRSVWGPKYPFYANGYTEAYGLVKAFYDDYEPMYQRFADWLMAEFAPRCQPGGDLSISLYDKVVEFLTAHEAYLEGDGFAQLFAGRKDNQVFQTFVAKALERGEFVMFELIREIGADGDFELLQQKTKPGDRDRRRIVFSTPFNEWRLMLKAYHGFEDASTTVGHLRRKK